MMRNNRLLELLSKYNLKLSTAESCTGGLVAKRITDVSGSSAVFNCGIVSYSNEIKESVLGVSHKTLETYGAVSEQTVREMVKGVLRISGADIAVSVSGIAGPTSDNTKKPVGTIWLAVSNGKKTYVRHLHKNFIYDIRNSNRNYASDVALKLILLLVGE